MSEDGESSLARDDDDPNPSKHLMTFCMQLVHHSQWKSQRMFLCGSMGDIPLFREIVYELKLDGPGLDCDRMTYPTRNHYVANRAIRFPETFTGGIVRIYTEDVHVGYAILIKEKDNTELMFSELHQVTDDSEVRNGPAIKVSNERDILKNTRSLSDTVIDTAESKKLDFEDSDQVYAVHSPYWPEEATEWITRGRSRGFPSKSVIKQVIRYGCDFVQTSHKLSNNDSEWRFSFSRAELFLTGSWTTSQRIVYDTLWVINKRMRKKKTEDTKTKSYLCTYYFKTLMFWACEKNDSEFWSDDHLIRSVSELLKEMKNNVELKVCKNYFIPDNNMMDHLFDTDLSYEIDYLGWVSQSYRTLSAIVDGCRKQEFESANITTEVEFETPEWIERTKSDVSDAKKRVVIETPDWIKRAFLICQFVDDDDDNYADLFRTDLTTDLQNALYVELSDIHRGLRFQKMSVDCRRSENIIISENHLLLAVNLCESQERVFVENNSARLDYILTHDYIKVGKDDHGHYRDDKCKNKPEEQGRKIRITGYISLVTEGEDLSYSDTHIQVQFKEWPGRSPTVNISWFIAKAYLANLYYTTQRDVSLAIKTCDDIIDVYRQSKMNNRFAERTFPVVLSTQWTRIYDKDIQELLGFYSLCSYVFDASSRSVYLGVCPVQFALYLKLRIGVIQAFLNPRSVRDQISVIIEYIEKYNEHIDLCLCDAKVINGSIVLLKILDRLV